MNIRESTETFTSAVEAADWDTARSYLADDFQFSGTMLPSAQGIQEWLGLSMALRAGIPDLSFNFAIHEIDEEAGTGRVSSRLTGTHTADLDLTGMGLGIIPATNIAFEAGEEFSTGSVRDGLMTSIHIEQGPDRGIFHMLQQLGIQPPMP